MKKYPILFLSALFSTILLISCGDKTKEETFANLTIEQNKTKIQDDGLATMEKLNGMTEMSSVFAFQDLQYLLDTAAMPDQFSQKAVLNLIAPMARLDKNVQGLTNLRSTEASIDSLTSLFAEMGGVYTYVPATNEFTRVANTTEITFLYPIGTSSTNNGKLTIDHLTVKSSTNPNIAGEFPKTLLVELFKNNLSLFSFEWKAEYDADCVPISWSTDFNFVEGYAFTQSMLNTDTEITWEFAYTLNDANILSAKFGTKGNFTYDVLSNPDSLAQEDWMDQVLDNANAYIQLGNLKVTGVVDYTNLKKAMDNAFPDGQDGSEADVTKSAELMNQYAKLVVLYAEEKTVIALSNFYKKEYTDSYWDYNSNQYVEETYFDIGLQFQFKDGSYFDQSFFDQGFEELQTAFTDMQLAFQTSYAQ